MSNTTCTMGLVVMVAVSFVSCAPLRRQQNQAQIAPADAAVQKALSHDLRFVRMYYRSRNVGVDPRFGHPCGDDICYEAEIPKPVLAFLKDSLRLTVRKRETLKTCSRDDRCNLRGVDRITIVQTPRVSGDTIFVPLILEQQADGRGKGGILRNGFTYVMIKDGPELKVLPGALDVWTAPDRSR